MILGMKNDLAFLIDFSLYLYEHQSTVNPNMPLRFLQYVSDEYSKLTASARKAIRDTAYERGVGDGETKGEIKAKREDIL